MPGRTASSGELDLQFVDVAELDLDLEIDFVGHADGDATAVPLELDRVVVRQGVRQGVERGGGLLAAEVLGLGDLEQVHGGSSGAIGGQHRTERLLARYRGEMRRDKRVDSVTEVPWPASEQLMRRQRWYFLLMGVYLTLIVLAWTWVRLWSVPLAVGMSAVAAVIPPIAAFVGSNGVRGG
jgi:hypothetical protein